MADESEIKVPKLSKQNPEKCKKIIKLFDIEDDTNSLDKQQSNKIKISYNEKIFFNPNNDNNLPEEKEINKFINNVITNTRKESGSSIKFNLNINNNYYNSNYNYVLNSTNEESKDKKGESENEVSKENSSNGITGFFKKVLGFNNNNRNNSVPNSDMDNKAERKSNISARNSSTSLVNKNASPVKSGRMSVWSNNSAINQGRRTHTSASINNQQQSNFIFFPCINCNNLIHFDEIENHSTFCLKVKEEVIVAESSQFSYHTIDYKLKKLQEHINQMKNMDYSSNICIIF
jgi:hypothetical protein